LHDIEGVGPKTVEKLLREFGSAERVRAASDEDLIKLVGPAAARKIRERVSPKAELESAAPFKIL
jgi:excinuclease ABC subunit C